MHVPTLNSPQHKLQDTLIVLSNKGALGCNYLLRFNVSIILSNVETQNVLFNFFLYLSQFD